MSGGRVIVGIPGTNPSARPPSTSRIGYGTRITGASTSSAASETSKARRTRSWCGPKVIAATIRIALTAGKDGERQLAGSYLQSERCRETTGDTPHEPPNERRRNETHTLDDPPRWARARAGRGGGIDGCSR